MKEIYFLSFVLLLFVLLLPSPGMSQSPLKIGALIPYNGRWGDSGRECARGMLDAAKWLNQHEGISGKKLEIIIIDDTSQTAEALAAYRKLNEIDRISLLYVYNPETALMLTPLFHFDRIPTFFGSLPSQLGDASKYPYAFSITPTPLDLAKIAMRFISDNSGLKVTKTKVILVGSSGQSDRYFIDVVKEYARTLGLDAGQEVKMADSSQTEEDMTKQITSLLDTIKDYGPNFAFLSLTSKEVSSLLEEAKKTDIKTKWICNKRGFDETLVPYEGVWGVQPISPFGEGAPGMAVVKEAHQKWHPYDSHTLSYVEGWATIQVIAEALRRSLLKQDISRERIKLELETFKDFITGGLTPPITFTPKDHRPSIESRIFAIKDGKVVRQTSFISLER